MPRSRYDLESLNERREDLKRLLLTPNDDAILRWARVHIELAAKYDAEAEQTGSATALDQARQNRIAAHAYLHALAIVKEVDHRAPHRHGDPQ